MKSLSPLEREVEKRDHGIEKWQRSGPSCSGVGREECLDPLVASREAAVFVYKLETNERWERHCSDHTIWSMYLTSD